MLLRRAVSHHDELPVLAVGAGGRLEGKLEAAQHDGVVDRVGQHLAHRPLGEHHSIEGHLQTSFHLAEGAVTFRTSVEACPFIGHCQQPADRANTGVNSTANTLQTSPQASKTDVWR